MARHLGLSKATIQRVWSSDDIKPHRTRIFKLSCDEQKGASFTNVRTLIEAIEAFISRWNQTAASFEWTKEEVHQQKLRPFLR
jgi:hypothetical protein